MSAISPNHPDQFPSENTDSGVDGNNRTLSRITDWMTSTKGRLLSALAVGASVIGCATYFQGESIEKRIEKGTITTQDCLKEIAEARTNGHVGEALQKCEQLLKHAEKNGDYKLIQDLYQAQMATLAHVKDDPALRVDSLKFAIDYMNNPRAEATSAAFTQHAELLDGRQGVATAAFESAKGHGDVKQAIHWAAGESFSFPPSEHSLNLISFLIQRGDKESLTQAQKHIESIKTIATRQGIDLKSLPTFKSICHAEIIIQSLTTDDPTQLQDEMREACKNGTLSMTPSTLYTIAMCFPRDSEIYRQLNAIGDLKLKNLQVKAECARAVIEAFQDGDTSFEERVRNVYDELKVMPLQKPRMIVERLGDEK